VPVTFRGHLQDQTECRKVSARTTLHCRLGQAWLLGAVPLSFSHRFWQARFWPRSRGLYPEAEKSGVLSTCSLRHRTPQLAAHSVSRWVCGVRVSRMTEGKWPESRACQDAPLRGEGGLLYWPATNSLNHFSVSVSIPFHNRGSKYHFICIIDCLGLHFSKLSVYCLGYNMSIGRPTSIQTTCLVTTTHSSCQETVSTSPVHNKRESQPVSSWQERVSTSEFITRESLNQWVHNKRESQPVSS
jgi:hypothetical protein